MSEALIPINLDQLRDATHRLAMREWFGESTATAIYPGYANDVLMVIEFADMHQTVMQALHAAIRAAAEDNNAHASRSPETDVLLERALSLAERALQAQLAKPCRCGWDGNDEHLCHRCHGRPGQRQSYQSTSEFSLVAGQPKSSMRETWACDECWAQFKARRAP